MPTIHNWQEYIELEEVRAMLKAAVRKQADEIPTLLQKKQAEYV